MSTKHRLVITTVLMLAAVFVLPAAALAQRGGGPPPGRGGGGGAPPVVVHTGPRVAVGVGWGYGWGYGPWGPYGAWGYGWGPWGPWGPWGGYWGGPCCYYDYMYAQARIQVLPKETEVFVDGYRAGTTDDFDGIFQRLNVWPGEHEITLYLEGYRTERHQMYMAQGTTANLKGTLEKLPAGEKSEPPPRPEPRRQPPPDENARGQAAAPRQAAPPEPQIEIQPEPLRYGAVSVKVTPADAEILIDEHVWTVPGADQRLNVQLAAGRHHIEVRRAGYETYAEDILIRQGSTMTLNVALSKK